MLIPWVLSLAYSVISEEGHFIDAEIANQNETFGHPSTDKSIGLTYRKQFLQNHAPSSFSLFISLYPMQLVYKVTHTTFISVQNSTIRNQITGILDKQRVNIIETSIFERFVLICGYVSVV